VAVVVGVVGIWLGFPQADPLVGLGIAAVIVWILAASIRVTIRRLLDGVEPSVLDAMETVAAATPGVERVDRVRARWTGHRLEAEIDLAVADDLTVAEAHGIAETVHHEVLHRVASAEHVTVHVNPVHDAAAHVLTGHHAAGGVASPESGGMGYATR
jgi:cation diffusion facilitator family transporter